MILTNNFAGLSCPYYAVGAPLTAVRHGVRSVATDRGELIAEGYGVMDRLSYRWNGMLLSEVTAEAGGQDFVGRTGFPLSGTGGGTASYGWNGAGLLNSDTSRGITRTTYNHLSLPTSVTFSDKSHVDYTYNAAGEVQTVTTYAMVAGAKRPVKVGQRSYCGDFVFEGDSLTEVNFAGGYFDGEGRPHFRHADWQGNVAMVTDRDGQIEQHNGYYPYGEPWREPTGQNRLFGGKERMRDDGLNDYDYVARRLNSATGIWGQPDPMAGDFAGTNPYVFCGANPIKFIDPSGKAAIYFKGEYIGSDGVDDDRTYVIPDPQGTLYTEDNYTAESVGFSEEVISAMLRVVKDSNGNKNEFHANQDVYSLMIEIPGSEKSIGEMDDELSKYDPSSNHRELGGTLTKEAFTPSEPGPIIENEDSVAYINIQGAGKNCTVHGHPFGFGQFPSPKDFDVPAGTIHLVVGMENQKVYIHNEKGILASVNYDRFLNWFNVSQKNIPQR